MTRSRIVLVLVGMAVISGGVIARNALRKPRVRVEIPRARRGPVARSESSNATGRPLATVASHESRSNDPAAAVNAEPEPDPAPPPIFDGNTLIGELEVQGRAYRCPPQATGVGAGGDCGGAIRHRPLSRPGRTRPAANQFAPSD